MCCSSVLGFNYEQTHVYGQQNLIVLAYQGHDCSLCKELCASFWPLLIGSNKWVVAVVKYWSWHLHAGLQMICGFSRSWIWRRHSQLTALYKDLHGLDIFFKCEYRIWMVLWRVSAIWVAICSKTLLQEASINTANMVCSNCSRELSQQL